VTLLTATVSAGPILMSDLAANGHLLQYFVAEDTTDAPSQAFMACT
jgi:hypothetical protein